MSQNSKIEWTERTWNPVRGCTKISPGCKHCYAETFAERWRGVPGHPYEQGFDLRLVPEKLAEPLKRRKPTTYFVNSMSDLFHERVPFEYVAAVFGVMAATPRHTYQVLTKRPERMREFFEWVAHEGEDSVTNMLGCLQSMMGWRVGGAPDGERVTDPAYEKAVEDVMGAEDWPLPNVWLGVSVEDRKYGVPRIDELRATPAAVRFLSVEPLLEDLGQIDLTGIDWVIVGGESGHGARPMHPDWARSIRDQCVAAGVPFLFKQWGAWVPRDHTEHPPKGSNWGVLERDGNYIETATTWTEEPNGGVAIRLVGKDKAGRELDGRTWDEFPAAALCGNH